MQLLGVRDDDRARFSYVRAYAIVDILTGGQPTLTTARLSTFWFATPREASHCMPLLCVGIPRPEEYLRVLIAVACSPLGIRKSGSFLPQQQNKQSTGALRAK